MADAPSYQDLEKRVRELEAVEFDYRHLKKALARQREWYLSLFDHVADSIFVLDVESGHVVYCNHQAALTSGYNRDELLCMTVYDLEVGLTHAEIEKFLQNKSTPSPIALVNGVSRRKDGLTHPAEVRVSYLDTADRRYLVATIRNTSERERAETALAESEKRLRRLSDNIPNGVIFQSDSGNDGAQRRLTYVSAGVNALIGVAPQDALGELGYFYRQIHPEDLPRMVAAEESAIAGVRPFRIEVRLLTPHLGERWFLIISAPTRLADGRLVWDGLALDITDRKKAELALRESEQRFRKIFQEAHLGIVIVQPTMGVENANPAFCRMVGYTAAELKTTTLGTISHPEDAVRTRENVVRLGRKEIPLYQTEKRYIHKSGTDVWVNLVVSAIRDERDELQYYISTMEDITKRKQAEEEKSRLQEQFLQAQKMESIGRLAGGVAHDFNNMLAIILGHTEMALEKADSAHPLYSDLTEIRKAADRSADLTRQLLAFARKQTISPKMVDLNAAVEGMLTMLRRLIGENIELQWGPATKLWQVKIDPTQIDQILANLCVNARDAINNSGRISIATDNVTLDGLALQARSDFPDGDYVMLAVSDNGQGMDAETRAHIFEPFFTTKDVGEGTGLGLATIYGIVKQNKGFIYAHSEPGQGTTFKIYLPRVAAEPVVKTGSAASTGSGGPETILLVEDEPMILEMVAKMLELKGYTILAAVNPKQALQLAREHSSVIDLLLTDVVMPEMNGLELTRLIQEKHPDIRALYMSGYSADVITSQGVLDEGMHFIQKPFQIRQLGSKVREVLQCRSSSLCADEWKNNPWKWSR